MIKKLLLSLALIISANAWADNDFKTINQTLDQLESEPDYEGKRLDIQYFLTRKCAGAYQVLVVEIGDKEIEEITSRFIRASVGFRMMIGGNKPGGLDKTRDEIFVEVNEDIQSYKEAYLYHLVTWYESPERNPEAIFSKPFAEDLSLCISIEESMSKD